MAGGVWSGTGQPRHSVVCAAGDRSCLAADQFVRRMDRSREILTYVASSDIAPRIIPPPCLAPAVSYPEIRACLRPRPAGPIFLPPRHSGSNAGMSDERKKGRAGFWIAVALVAML